MPKTWFVSSYETLEAEDALTVAVKRVLEAAKKVHVGSEGFAHGVGALKTALSALEQIEQKD